ncbi:transcriptional regulator, AraC family [Pseudovibrio denitrificans]|uniref:Transcriptional regulator, AraC family n=1 Tax=Pseudovibrio denitrificans TaxID=258256 RepID=A0A1I7DBU5_9HYPH|nr:AraC family transcriptional regulator [Pseudovibrio denitrificans]SFU09085.1 transcriptional regulator, AraC family [Pseudovibrio denitrificans]
MPSLPLPFFTALFLCFILLRLVAGYGRKLPPMLLVTICLYALQSVLLGIKWGMGGLPSWSTAGLALLLPPATWLSFLQLTNRFSKKAIGWTAGATTASFGVLVVAPNFNIPSLIDLTSVAVYLGYGALFFRSATVKQWEWTSHLPLDQMFPTRQAQLIAGAVFSTSALVDLAVASDFALNRGSHAATIVGTANLVMLVALISLVVLMSRKPSVSQQPEAQNEAEKVSATPEQVELVDALDQLMRSENLYRDENLSLDKLARKLRVPARQISTAVNTVREINLPQYTNGFRVTEACHLLETTDTPITAIIYEVGFTTKSNFNREFQRVTGKSPSTWRKESRTSGVTEPA